VNTSRSPSPSKSPIATPWIFVPFGADCVSPGCRAPVPRPRSTVILSIAPPTTSGMPSRSMSPTASCCSSFGPSAFIRYGDPGAGVSPPAPSPRSTATFALPPVAEAETASSRPSRFMSAATTATGRLWPTANGAFGASVRTPPGPPSFRPMCCPASRLPTRTSSRPSPLKSPTPRPSALSRAANGEPGAGTSGRAASAAAGAPRLRATARTGRARRVRERVRERGMGFLRGSDGVDVNPVNRPPGGTSWGWDPSVSPPPPRGSWDPPQGSLRSRRAPAPRGTPPGALPRDRPASSASCRPSASPAACACGRCRRRRASR